LWTHLLEKHHLYFHNPALKQQSERSKNSCTPNIDTPHESKTPVAVFRQFEHPMKWLKENETQDHHHQNPLNQQKQTIFQDKQTEGFFLQDKFPEH